MPGGARGRLPHPREARPKGCARTSTRATRRSAHGNHSAHPRHVRVRVLASRARRVSPRAVRAPRSRPRIRPPLLDVQPAGKRRVALSGEARARRRCDKSTLRGNETGRLGEPRRSLRPRLSARGCSPRSGPGRRWFGVGADGVHCSSRIGESGAGHPAHRLLLRSENAQRCLRGVVPPPPSRLWGERVRYLAAVSSPSADWTGETGYVHDVVRRALGEGLREREVYFAGPPAMAAAMQIMLQGAGVAPAQVHYDEFY